MKPVPGWLPPAAWLVLLTAAALGLYPSLKRRVRRSPQPLAEAVRLAGAGNVIDFGVRGSVTEADVAAAIDEAEGELADGQVDRLIEALRQTHDVLYLADNAGELVFDRLLLEELADRPVTVAVRGAAVINDATRADAEAAGLTERFEVIDNGSDAPGTVLADCTDDFRRRFEAAGVVLAKGQGNCESLSEGDREIFFLLKIKCPVMAGRLGGRVGELVLRRRGATAPGTEATTPLARAAVGGDESRQTP
jgi:hypothetical protein